jgi:acyl-CoA synthetase (AMP-forming)/AMP-acid ligase II
MTGWNIADVLEAVAREVPESPALICGDRRFSWSELDTRAENVARHLHGAGLRRQDKVVQYLRNCPEYLESFIAALKASLVPVNTNYRYGPAELTHLWDDADARAVVFAASFTATIEQMREFVPGVLSWLWVDDGTGTCPSWATPYEGAATETARPPQRGWERDGDDIVLLYTGGTTGLPKGVMWRQDDLFMKLGNASNGRYPDTPDVAYAASRVASRGRRHLPAAPLMHGAGCLTCLPVLARGGAAVLLEQTSFSAEELLDTVEREQVNSVGWVGDAFAKPVLAALDSNPQRWDLASWSIVTSGGVLFSDEVKRGLIRHIPGLLIADVYGASETLEAARSISTAASPQAPARSFTVGNGAAVFNEDDIEVSPGSGEVGRVAFAGRLPLGYYKDPVKSAANFRTLNGRRFSMTGDYATVEADGRITMLGRGSACINTGGEKVYPEEVEEVLKRHPAVEDVAILGVPDDRFGEKIAAAVQLAPGFELDVDDLREHVRAHLAAYKAPRLFVAVEQVTRGASGKVDVPAVRALLQHGAATS